MEHLGQQAALNYDNTYTCEHHEMKCIGWRCLTTQPDWGSGAALTEVLDTSMPAKATKLLCAFQRPQLLLLIAGSGLHLAC